MIIDGQKVQSKVAVFFDITDPATNKVIARTPQCTAEDHERAAESCAEACKKWRFVPPSQRARVMHKYEGAIRDNADAIAAVLTEEQGKTIVDAKGYLFRGLEVVEISTNIPAMIQNETLQGAATGVDVPSYKVPLGVCAGIYGCR